MDPEVLSLPVASVLGPFGPSSDRYEFGRDFTPHIITARWGEDAGWEVLELGPRRPLAVDPAMVSLQYGQSVFEGLKAHRQADGRVVLFRPLDHARRFRGSASRLAMPELPDALFLSALERFVERDGFLLPDDPALSLYLRPSMFATEPHLGLRPSRSYLFLLQACVVSGFFVDDPPAMSVRVRFDQARSAVGGVGAIKAAGNYAPTCPAQQAAAEEGCSQVVWVDSAQQRWVEEMGAMNIVFVRGTGRDAVLSTPPLTGTLLAGVTRDSVLTLAAHLGHRVVEEPMEVARWQHECATGEITETFACGTAALVAPVSEVRAGAVRWSVGDGGSPVARRIRDMLHGIHRGTEPDPFGWIHHPATNSMRDRSDDDGQGRT